MLKQESKMFQRGYRFTEQFFNKFDSRKLTKCDKKIQLNASVIRESLKSKDVGIFLQCLRENPSLLQQCLSEKDFSSLINLDKGKEELYDFVVPEKEEIVEEITPISSGKFYDLPPGNNLTFAGFPKRNENMQQMIPVKTEEPEEDILEIPRSAFIRNNTYGNIPRFPQMNSFSVQINFDPQMFEVMRELGAIILEKVLIPKLRASSSNSIIKF